MREQPVPMIGGACSGLDEKTMRMSAPAACPKRAAAGLLTHFPLHRSVLCVECDTVFEQGPDTCPSCTCTQLVYLSEFVKPMERWSA